MADQIIQNFLSLCLTLLFQTALSSRSMNLAGVGNNVLTSRSEYEAHFQMHATSKEATASFCLQYRNRCYNHCGEKAKGRQDVAPGPNGLLGRAACSCDHLCLVYGDCCWDFHYTCPDQVTQYLQSHLRHAQSSCLGAYNYLRVSGANSSYTKAAETFNKLGVSFQDMHLYIASEGTAVTDTETSEQYISLRDFVRLNPGINTTQPERLVFWSSSLEASVFTTTNNLLSYLQGSGASQGSDFFIALNPPSSPADTLRSCIPETNQFCHLKEGGITVMMHNLTRACQVVFGHEAARNALNVSDWTATTLAPDEADDDDNNIPLPPERVPTESTPQTTVAESTTHLTPNCHHLMQQSTTVKKSPLSFSSLLVMDQTQTVRLVSSIGNHWTANHCRCFVAKEVGLQNKNQDHSVPCETRVICADGYIFVNGACVSPILMLVEANSVSEKILQSSRLLNHPDLSLWQDPSSCVSNGTKALIGTTFYGAYHVGFSKLSNADSDHLPLFEELRAAVAAQQAHNQTWVSQIKTLKLCFLMAAEDVESIGNAWIKQRNIDVSALTGQDYKHHDVNITNKACHEMPWAWMDNQIFSDPYLRCESTEMPGIDWEPRQAMEDIASSHTQSSHNSGAPKFGLNGNVSSPPVLFLTLVLVGLARELVARSQ